MKTLDDLLEAPDPAWPMIRQWIKDAANPVEALSPSDSGRKDALVAAQVMVRSELGAVIYETGGIFIDHGWLRVLGSGHPRLPRSAPKWNEGRGEGFFLVADDVVGGFFAINGGALGPGKGEVYYFAPDSLRWEGLQLKYGAWLGWCMSGKVGEFYDALRWPGWRDQVEKIGGDQGLSILPPLWTNEGKDIAKSSRSVVPIAELFDVQFHIKRQLDGSP